MSPSTNGSNSTSGTPGQPTQAPRRQRRNGSSAAPNPPGLDFHRCEPSGSCSKSTGSRLATTTKPASVVGVLVPSVTGWPPLSTPSSSETSGVTRHLPVEDPSGRCAYHELHAPA